MIRCSMSAEEHRLAYRGKTAKPPVDDLLDQYRYHLRTWCVYKRRARAGQGWAGWEHCVTIDEPAAAAVIRMAELDLGAIAAKVLAKEFKELTDRRDYVGNKGERLSPTAWSMYHKRCILCHSTKSKHKAGGRCYACYRARWLKKAGFNRLIDAINRREGQ